MKKTIGMIIIAFLLISFGLFIYFKPYYPPLPIESVSKREAAAVGKRIEGQIVKLGNEGGYEWYMAEAGQGMPIDKLKNMLEQEGWQFKEQFGAGLIFQKEGVGLNAESEMWTSKYMLFQVPENWR